MSVLYFFHSTPILDTYSVTAEFLVKTDAVFDEWQRKPQLVYQYVGSAKSGFKKCL
jgi:hypothetical protein